MQKRILFIVIVISFITLNSQSQGWVGSGGNNLNAVNSSLVATPINVGIGTNAPTAQLHTTGTIRHDNLTVSNNLNRVLVTDAQGNVFWRNAGTLGSQNAWLLNGNAGTSPTNNFLGTIDNQNLSFRTNNLQRMTILSSNGFVGVGVANPLVRLHVSNGLGAMGYPYESAVVENTGDTKFTVSSSDPTGVGGAALVLCNSNFQSGGVYNGYEMQYAINNGRWLRFNYVQRNTGGFITGGISNILILSDLGRVGVNLGPSGGGGTPILPTASFHTSGTVRFENLPTGSGTSLVIDNNGNIFRSTSFAGKGEGTLALGDKIEKLAEEIEILKKQILSLKTGKEIVNSDENGVEKPRLYQNAPNPFDKMTTIRYFIPSNVKGAVILITDSGGKMIEEFSVSNKNEPLLVNANKLTAGIYFYSLIVNGKIADSKKMLLTH